ncbi:MAG: hypothetical protein JW818_16560 [Pirellulales bacterium]|nr:hypothetical protein [Pirellulales bacterium]
MLQRLLLTPALLITAIAFFPRPSLATGWNDYSLTIAPGYTIHRCNTFDIGLTGPSGSIIYSPEEGGVTGPITGYIVAPDHIFLRTAGQRRRNAFQGDTFIDVDPSVEYFFVVSRSSDMLRGPFSLAEFEKAPEVAALESLDWTAPANPHPERARAGQVMFLAFAAMVYGAPLLLLVMVIYVVVRLFRPGRPDKADNSS